MYDDELKPCPFSETKFHDVPGYVEGYGCPICGGLSYHLRMKTKDIIAAMNQPMLPDLEVLRKRLLQELIKRDPKWI